MRQRTARLARAVFEKTGRGLTAVLLVLATGCGPESTTATITAIEPLDPNDCDLDWVTGDDGVVRAEHPAFGCVPLSDLVLITFDLAPDGSGRARTGYVYPYGTGRSGTHRSVAAGLAVGDTLPATYEVHHSFGIFSGAVSPSSTGIRIPDLDARLRAALPPLGTPRPGCPRSPDHRFEDDDE